MGDRNAFAAIQPGWDVFGSDNEKVGTVHIAGDDYLEVEKGLFFIKDLFIPRSAIADADPEARRVVLDVPRGRVGDMGWTEPQAITRASNVAAAESWGQGAIDEPVGASADRFDGARIEEPATGTARIENPSGDGSRIEEPADDLAASRVRAETIDPESVTMWSDAAGDTPPDGPREP